MVPDVSHTGGARLGSCGLDTPIIAMGTIDWVIPHGEFLISVWFTAGLVLPGLWAVDEDYFVAVATITRRNGDGLGLDEGIVGSGSFLPMGA